MSIARLCSAPVPTEPLAFFLSAEKLFPEKFLFEVHESRRTLLLLTHAAVLAMAAASLRLG